jgi:short-subunit dehydrogenase
MLIRTSASPSILLVSSVAAIIPAPTRALYAATKASSLLLFQALAIEHPQIAFSFVLPATIEGDFRAGAVDSHIGGVRENDPNKHGLKIDDVARKSIDAVDQGKTGNIILPWFPFAIGHFLYNVWPTYIEAQARKKYNFHP